MVSRVSVFMFTQFFFLGKLPQKLETSKGWEFVGLKGHHIWCNIRCMKKPPGCPGRNQQMRLQLETWTIIPRGTSEKRPSWWHVTCGDFFEIFGTTEILILLRSDMVLLQASIVTPEVRCFFLGIFFFWGEVHTSSQKIFGIAWGMTIFSCHTANSVCWFLSPFLWSYVLICMVYVLPTFNHRNQPFM